MNDIVTQELELFDDSVGYEGDIGLKLTHGLNEADRKLGGILYWLFNELWGLAITVGDPGSGKDLFGNWLTYTTKRLFPQKRILRDEKPRKLFGSYDGLFNERVIHDDLKRMRDAARGVKTIHERDEIIEKAADDWVGQTGKVLLKNSLLYLTEFWRYCYNREPQNPMNKTMGGIHKMYRHMNCLILGTTQQEEDLDRRTCLPWVKWRVSCTRSRQDSTKYMFLIYRVKYDKRLQMLIAQGSPYPIWVDAGKPRDFIGDGKIIIKKMKYEPQNIEENMVLECIKSGIDSYSQLVEFLEQVGMSEAVTLATLKELCLKLPNRKPKFVIWYPCFYFIYNSRSAPQLTTTVKVGD